MEQTLVLTPQMMVVFGLLLLTVVLFVTEVVRIDVAAIGVMVLLGLLTLIPGLEGISDPMRLFDGFASNAVISIIAVMIIGAGLDRTGLLSRLAGLILRIGGSTERRVVPLVSGSVGVISSFMQNVGAAALFIPVLSRISAQSRLPMSRLLMPMGFCAILGGTLTMVGSSPLILLNDLLPADMQRFELFDVTPIGLALLTTGILYFIVFGRFVLPDVKGETDGESTLGYLRRVYGFDYEVREIRVQQQSSWVGKTLIELERHHGVVVVATFMDSELRVGPWGQMQVAAGARLAVLGKPTLLEALQSEPELVVEHQLDVFADALADAKAGIAEVVIPPRSALLGRTLTDVAMRKTYGLSVLAMHRGGHTEREALREQRLRAGDVLVCHCRWDALLRLERDRDFVVMTSDYPRDTLRPHKVGPALLFFALAIGLILFTDLRLSVALLTGALGMVLTGVLSMDEAYEAVSWKTVFLLASLIPLGAAVNDTGAAAWIAQSALMAIGMVEPWVLQVVIAILATVFTLIMSNVGAVVLLVPLAISVAQAAQSMGIDADPRIFALTAAIATSNSFLLPTHQVNALIMGPGGYRVKDFMRAGGIMTVLFLIVSLVMLNLLF